MKTCSEELGQRIEALEAEIKRLREERLAFAAESEQRQSRIEAVEGLVNVLNNRANHESDLAPLYASIVEQLREALGGKHD